MTDIQLLVKAKNLPTNLELQKIRNLEIRKI